MTKLTLEDLPNLRSADKTKALRLLNALLYNWFMGKTTSYPYWGKKIGLKDLLKITLVLKDIIDVDTSVHNFSTIALKDSFVMDTFHINKAELEEFRLKNKFLKYVPNSCKMDRYDYLNKVVYNGDKEVSPVQKPNLTRLSASPYYLDIDSMVKYREIIIQDTLKSLENRPKSEGLDYTAVVNYVFDYIVKLNPETTVGEVLLDSRMRAIYSCTEKVLNVIASKWIRALLIIPDRYIDNNKASKIAVKARIYRAITSILKKNKGKTLLERTAYGKAIFEQGELEVTTYKHLWANRLIRALKSGKHINVPVEIDATASMLQITSVLLNDEALMEATNVISTGVINDPWYINDSFDRDELKKVLIPALYGSTVKKSTDISIVRELNSGKYSSAMKFKDFIISNVKCKEEMQVNINNQKFVVRPNKFHNLGDTPVKYQAYDTNKNKIVSFINHELKQKPDLQQFPVYFQTLLIHNLDSQLAESTVQNLEWGICIYDAFIVSIYDTESVTEAYSTAIKAIHSNRDSILANFLKSIGINRIPAFLAPTKSIEVDAVLALS